MGHGRSVGGGFVPVEVELGWYVVLCLIPEVFECFAATCSVWTVGLGFYVGAVGADVVQK